MAFKPLSKKQSRILALLALGKSNLEIALELGIQEPVMKALVTTVMERCGITSRQQAASHLKRRTESND